VSKHQSESLDADGTDHSLAHKQAAYEELIIPCGELGVLFMSAVLVVVVLLGGFSTLPAENNKSVGSGIAAFLSRGVSVAIEPANARLRGSKGSLALHASEARGSKVHRYRHHNDVARQRERQLVKAQTVDCLDSSKDEATNGVRPLCVP
jgi:hypothetical protein